MVRIRTKFLPSRKPFFVFFFWTIFIVRLAQFLPMETLTSWHWTQTWNKICREAVCKHQKFVCFFSSNVFRRQLIWLCSYKICGEGIKCFQILFSEHCRLDYCSLFVSPVQAHIFKILNYGEGFLKVNFTSQIRYWW